jgi:ribosomal subunit interface protein
MKLKWNLIGKNMRPHSQLRAKIQEKVDKLEGHLQHFPEDATNLQVSLNRHPKKEWFTVALNLHVPSNTLHSEKSGEDPVPVLDHAFKTLLRELGGLKSELRREVSWKPAAIAAVPPPPRVASLPAARPAASRP